MKRCMYRIMCLYGLLLAITARPCPTCIGRLGANTPPLFSKEYDEQYRLHDDGTLEITSEEYDNDEAE